MAQHGCLLGRCLYIVLLCCFFNIKQVRCSCNVSQWEDRLQTDLAYFRQNGGITTELLQEADSVVELTEGYHVKIINNSLFYRPLGRMTKRTRLQMDSHAVVLMIVKALCWQVFPDVEFVISSSDRRALVKYHGNVPPIFSFAKDSFFEHDILVPYWNMLWPGSKRAVAKSLQVPWHDKVPMLLWRGSPTGHLFSNYTSLRLPRTHLVRICKKIPDVCDAGFHKWPAGHPMPAGMRLMNKIQEGDLHKHKYVILVDGNTVPSSRSHDMMLTKSVIFKQESPFVEFFYDDLVPYKHYIPVSYYISNLPQALDWAVEHDTQSYHIAEAAYQYAIDNFVDAKLACFWYRLLLEYSAMQKFKPKVDEHDIQFGCANVHVWNHLLRNTDYPCQHFSCPRLSE